MPRSSVMSPDLMIATPRSSGPSCDPRVHVHPQALCESTQVGAGTRIWAFAHVMSGAVLGKDCNIGDHAFIETGARIGDRVTIKNGAMIWDGVTIEDDVFIGPGVLFTNDPFPRSPRMPSARPRYQKAAWLVPTRVEQGASIGAGAVIRCGVTVGRYALVGAAALVTRDVASHRLVTGQPARPSGWVCVCGLSFNGQLECADCGRGFFESCGSSVAPRSSQTA